MYRIFYQLNCVPFAPTSQVGSAFLSAQHQTAIEEVIKGIEQQQGIIALIGEAGMGKTTLLRNALHKHQSMFKTVYINQTTAAIMGHSFPKGIIRSIGQELGQDIQDSNLSEMIRELQNTLVQWNQSEKNIVVIIDNAHYLSLETLQILPQIIQGPPYKPRLAQLILVGLPLLKQQLSYPKLKTLQQHIGLISTLSRLKNKESRTYIHNTLQRATSQPQAILSRQALNTIVQAAQGIPRNLNILATDILTSGFQNNQNPIPGYIARRVVAEFAGRPLSSSTWLRWLSAAGLIVGFCLLIVLAIWKGSQLPTDAKILLAMAHPDMSSPTHLNQPASKPAAPASLISILPTVTQILSPIEPPSKPVIQRVTKLIQQVFPAGGTFPLKVWASKGKEGVYRENEVLRIHVLAESDAYLQIDYYQVDGQVIHLLPNLLDSNQIAAGQIFTLGDSGNTFQFKVSAPFGVEILTVIARQKPFPVRPSILHAESAEDYIETLANHLQTYKRQGSVAAASLRIQTAKDVPTHLSCTNLPESYRHQ